MKFEPSIIAIGCTLVAAFAVGTVESQDIQPSQNKIFNILDANNDGKVTEKEFVITGLNEIFQSFDLDSSGKVSKKEFMEATAEHEIDAAAEWAAMSRGADEITFKQSLRNKVAVEEMKGYFKEVDKTGKGYITIKDLD